MKALVTACWQETLAWTALSAACLQVITVPVTPPLSAARAQQAPAGATSAPAMQQTGHAPRAVPVAAPAARHTTQPVSFSGSSSGTGPKAAAPAEPTAAGGGTTSAAPTEPTAAGVGATSAAPAEPVAAGVSASSAAPAPVSAAAGANTAGGAGATMVAPAPVSGATGGNTAGALSWADRARQAAAHPSQPQSPRRSAGSAGSRPARQVGGP